MHGCGCRWVCARRERHINPETLSRKEIKKVSWERIKDQVFYEFLMCLLL